VEKGKGGPGRRESRDEEVCLVCCLKRESEIEGGATLSAVMPALVAGIHVFQAKKQGVDGRDSRSARPGHDK
jgi:hypothetical protein